MTDTPAAPAPGTALAVPEYLKNLTQNKDARADAQSLAASSISIPRVSLKGRKFRLIEGGQEIQKPSDELDVVILAVEPGSGLFVKTYYEGQYNSGDSAPPTCASSNGIAPDPWVTTPQSARCATCPKNVFGSATSRTGKKSKACRDSKRIWIALPGKLSGTVFALGIPVTSLKNVSEYGRDLEKHGYPLCAVVTKLTMEDAEYPVLEFKMAGFLPEAEGMIAIQRKAAKDWSIGSGAPMIDHDDTPTPAPLPTAAAVAASVATPAAPTVPAAGAAAAAPQGESVLKNW